MLPVMPPPNAGCLWTLPEARTPPDLRCEFQLGLESGARDALQALENGHEIPISTAPERELPLAIGWASSTPRSRFKSLIGYGLNRNTAQRKFSGGADGARGTTRGWYLLSRPPRYESDKKRI
jgi:hypothetical protein